MKATNDNTSYTKLYSTTSQCKLVVLSISKITIIQCERERERERERDREKERTSDLRNKSSN